MSKNVFSQMMRGVDRHPAVNDRWLFCESATVAENEDPERLGRLKVVIPVIDADVQFDDWIVPAGLSCLGDGFGSLILPPKGAEVLVTGVLGQKFNLVWHASTYNEEMAAAEELSLDWPGIKTPANLTFIATLIQKLVAQNVQIVASQMAKVEAQTIHGLATGEHKIRGNTVKIEADGTITINGGSVVVQPSGNVTITPSGNCSIAPSGNLTLNGRTVNKTGPPI